MYFGSGQNQYGGYNIPPPITTPIDPRVNPFVGNPSATFNPFGQQHNFYPVDGTITHWQDNYFPTGGPKLPVRNDNPFIPHGNPINNPYGYVTPQQLFAPLINAQNPLTGTFWNDNFNPFDPVVGGNFPTFLTPQQMMEISQNPIGAYKAQQNIPQNNFRPIKPLPTITPRGFNPFEPTYNPKAPIQNPITPRGNVNPNGAILQNPNYNPFGY